MYAILNKNSQYFGVAYNSNNESNLGYEAATFADGFNTEIEMIDFAKREGIQLD
jgi:hypothetical protein